MRRQAVGLAYAELRHMLLEDAEHYDTLAEQAERNSRGRQREDEDGR